MNDYLENNIPDDLKLRMDDRQFIISTTYLQLYRAVDGGAWPTPGACKT